MSEGKYPALKAVIGFEKIEEQEGFISLPVAAIEEIEAILSTETSDPLKMIASEFDVEFHPEKVLMKRDDFYRIKESLPEELHEGYPKNVFGQQEFQVQNDRIVLTYKQVTNLFIHL